MTRRKPESNRRKNMMAIVETNAAAILVMLLLWGTLTWMATYLYMSYKLQNARYTIDYMDEMFMEQEDTIKGLKNGIELRDDDIKYYVGVVFELENHIQLMEEQR